MAKTNDNEKAMAATAGADVSVPETAIAKTPESQVMATASPDLDTDSGDLALLPPEFLAETMAQIQGDLKTLFVDKLTSAKSLMESEANLNITDSFIMTFSFPDDPHGGQRVVYEVVDDNGVVYYVAQNPIGSRLSWVGVFDNVRKIGRKLTIPNCQFKEAGTGKFGNKPIILTPSAASKPIIR